MPRLTPAQICYGTLAVVVATVALLAASGAHSLLAISLLVILGLTLGTIAAALAITAPVRRGTAPGRSRTVARSGPRSSPQVEAIPARERAHH
ncbi:hypothetical protein [Streptacidiphilus sp. EB129]|jgi:hypothetical protein|uniref:hypothetical protein n=1 Tax=Streptacidiphilus sp. EB129 TaxID=3156262 RepID=UPI00351438B2